MPIGNLRNQNITYWPMGTVTGDGYNTYSGPVVTKGRWEDREVLINEGTTGERLSSNSRVYLQENLDQGVYVYKGISASPTPPTGARKIIRAVDIPSVDGRTSERVYYLD